MNVLLPAFITSEFKDSLPNRVSTFLTIPCHRYGHSVHVNVLRNDDVEPNVGVTSF